MHLYPKVTASLLYTISDYERFHRNALLSDSGGNMYKVKCLVVTSGVEKYYCSLQKLRLLEWKEFEKPTFLFNICSPYRHAINSEESKLETHFLIFMQFRILCVPLLQ